MAARLQHTVQRLERIRTVSYLVGASRPRGCRTAAQASAMVGATHLVIVLYQDKRGKH
jgi:hypothetical protein